MSCYDVDKLMSQARRLAADYHQATGQTLPLSNEIARFDAMNLLDLDAPEQASAGVDAIGKGERSGQRMQIKVRVLFPDTKAKQRIGQLAFEGSWDSVLLVLMNAQYETQEIIEARRPVLTEALANLSANKRGAMSVNKFKTLGTVVWARSESY